MVAASYPITTIYDRGLAVSLAAMEGHESMVRYLRNQDASDDLLALGSSGRWPPVLIAAVWAHHGGQRKDAISMAQSSLCAGADPNLMDPLDMTPLMQAAQEGDLPMTLLLIKNGADINLKNSCREAALSLALRKAHPALVRAPLDFGA